MVNKKYTSAHIWIVDRKGNRIARTRKHKIFLHSKTKGVIINDGRQVVKINGNWIYIAR